MDKKKELKLILEDGSEKIATILLYFEIPEFKKEYAIYTFGELDKENYETIYVSTVVENDEKMELQEIKTDDEWLKIKKVMKDVIKMNRV